MTKMDVIKEEINENKSETTSDEDLESPPPIIEKVKTEDSIKNSDKSISESSSDEDNQSSQSIINSDETISETSSDEKLQTPQPIKDSDANISESNSDEDLQSPPHIIEKV